MDQTFQMTPNLALIQVFVFFACVGIGYLLSLPLKPPENPTLWLLLIAAVFMIGYLPILTQRISILGAPHQVNNLIWYVGGGVIIGLMIKRGRQKA